MEEVSHLHQHRCRGAETTSQALGLPESSHIPPGTSGAGAGVLLDTRQEGQFVTAVNCAATGEGPVSTEGHKALLLLTLISQGLVGQCIVHRDPS